MLLSGETGGSFRCTGRSCVQRGIDADAARKLMAEYRAPVVVEVILERVTPKT
jgi:glyoxylate carboligase